MGIFKYKVYVSMKDLLMVFSYCHIRNTTLKQLFSQIYICYISLLMLLCAVVVVK